MRKNPSTDRPLCQRFADCLSRELAYFIGRGADPLRLSITTRPGRALAVWWNATGSWTEMDGDCRGISMALACGASWMMEE